MGGILPLRGGASGDLKAAREDWASVPPQGKREFAQLAGELDRWLSQVGVALVNATRPQILEALHRTRAAKLEGQAQSPKGAGQGVSADGWHGAREDLSEAENQERMLLACKLGDRDVLGAAVKRGAQANASDAIGWTGLHHAAFLNHVLVAQALLEERGTDPDARTPDGITPLMLAASRGNALLVEQLLVVGKARVDLTEPRTLRTALSLAALQGWKAVCNTLLQHGADLRHEDLLGKTPPTLALSNRYLELGWALSVADSTEAEEAERARLLLHAQTPLSARETTIAAQCALPLGSARAKAERRRPAWMGERLLERLDPTKYDLSKPGFPSRDDLFPVGSPGSLAFEAGRELTDVEKMRHMGNMTVPDWAAHVERQWQEAERRRELQGSSPEASDDSEAGSLTEPWVPPPGFEPP